jgi:hypothetical protein
VERFTPGSTCAFCGRALAEVGHYLVAPDAVICDGCITFAADALQQAGPEVRVLRPEPQVVGDPPDDHAVRAIVSAVRAVFSNTSDDATRDAALEDGERLGPLYVQARGRFPDLGQDYGGYTARLKPAGLQVLFGRHI